MNTNSDTFKRKEVKYLLSEKQHAYIRTALEQRMIPDLYGESVITSIYYDTENWSLIERSLDKPTYKEKLRVRVYGSETLRNTSQAFIEIKTKFKGIVYKRRIETSFEQASLFLNEASLAGGVDRQLASSICQGDARRRQIMNEIEALARRHGCVYPSMAISCFRTALALRDEYREQDEGFRVTFDERITWRDLRIARHAPSNLLLPNNQCVMEVKMPGFCPLWFVQILNKACAYPSSFSKYGMSYKARMTMLERSYCA